MTEIVGQSVESDKGKGRLTLNSVDTEVLTKEDIKATQEEAQKDLNNFLTAAKEYEHVNCIEAKAGGKNCEVFENKSGIDDSSLPDMGKGDSENEKGNPTGLTLETARLIGLNYALKNVQKTEIDKNSGKVNISVKPPDELIQGIIKEGFSIDSGDEKKNGKVSVGVNADPINMVVAAAANYTITW